MKSYNDSAPGFVRFAASALLSPHSGRSVRWRLLALALGVVAALALGGGCAEVEVLRPLPVDTSTSVSSSGGSGGSGGGGGVIRTIVVRDPMGNVQQTDNLLWDGDFEWQISFQDQYGWLYGATTNSIGFGLPPTVLGAACHSGVKCVRLSSGAVLLGIAVASEGSPLDVSLWSAPEDGSCASLEVFLLAQSGPDPTVLIAAAAPEADGDGWCRYQATVMERVGSQYLYVENQGSDTIIDDAVIAAAPAAMQQVAALPQVADKKKVARVRGWARAATEPRLPPPNEAEKRFRAHMRKRWGKR